MFTNTIAEPALKALELIKSKEFISSFYMAGGTACSIQIGHRISVDLDFFSNIKFDPTELLNKIKSDGIVLEKFEISDSTLKGWMGDAQLSFFYYPYELINPVVSFEENVKLADLVDIGLMKLIAIASRGSKKDFVDMYFILKKYNLSEMFDYFEKKFGTDEVNRYHYLKSLVYYDDADTDPDPKMLIDFNWDEIKKYFVQLISGIDINHG